MIFASPSLSLFDPSLLFDEIGIKSKLILGLSNKTYYQCFFDNFDTIMATEDATEKVKFNNRFFLE